VGERFSPFKFIKGLLPGINTAKALAFLAQYFWIFLLLIGIWGVYNLFHKPSPSSNTTTGDVKDGGIVNVVNNNQATPSQGLFVSLSSDRAMTGVYKEYGQFEVQLGAGKKYDDDFVADVTAKIKF